MTSNGSQNTIVITERPEFPWLGHEKLYAIPLNNKFIAVDQYMANMAQQITMLHQGLNESQLGIAMTANWGGNTSVSAGPYMLIGTTAYKFTLQSMDYSVGNAGGSFHVTIFNDGIPVPGLEDVLVDNTVRQTIEAIDNPAVLRGVEFSMLVFDVIGNPTNAWININGTTVAIPEQVQMVADAVAVGSSTAEAGGYFLRPGQGTGAAFGFATVESHTDFSEHTFVMDDPNFGRLDINPIG